jgi:hypothetical protein
MKEQTAMMEAINHLSIWVDNGLSLDKWIENYKDSYIKKEKEQIIDARNDALRDKYTSVYNDLITYGQAKIETKTSEQYYNQTYLEESK